MTDIITEQAVIGRGLMDSIIALQSSVDYVVSKDHDELLKKWVMIGYHFFKEAKRDKTDCSSINILCEQGNVSLDADATSNGSPLLTIKQTSENGHVDEVTFLATIDQDDAIRLAGMLIAWASDKTIHGQQGEDNGTA